MSQVNEDDPFEGLVTSQSLEAHREEKSSHGHFSKRDDGGDVIHRWQEVESSNSSEDDD